MVQSVTPTDNDVVCGRGRGYDMLAGNRAFRRLIKEHASIYSNSISTSRKRKSLITKTIREQLANENMRFLKKNRDGIWHEMGEKEIKLKIGHALRDAKEAALTTCGLSTSQATCTSSEVDTCCSGSLAAPLADHDTVSKQQQASDRKELPFPCDSDLITMVSADSSNVGVPVTCQDRVERPLTPEQLDTVEEMMLIEMLLKSPSQTHQQLSAEVSSWSDTFLTSENCSGEEEECISHLLSKELDNTLDDDFLDSLWDEEILKSF